MRGLAFPFALALAATGSPVSGQEEQCNHCGYTEQCPLFHHWLNCGWGGEGLEFRGDWCTPGCHPLDCSIYFPVSGCEPERLADGSTLALRGSMSMLSKGSRLNLAMVSDLGLVWRNESGYWHHRGQPRPCPLPPVPGAADGRRPGAAETTGGSG